MLRKLNFIFSRKQKLELLGLMAAFVVGSMLELVGVSAILPVVNVIVDPTLLKTDGFYQGIAGVLGASDISAFVARACIALILLYVVKNVYLLFMYNLQFRYTYQNRARISSDLFSTYLAQDYLSLVDHNVAELQRSITDDVELFFALVLALLNIICEGCTSLVLGAYLFYSSPGTTVSLVLVMLVFGLGFAKIYKKRLKATGEKLRTFAAIRAKWLLQAFGGVKEIKVLEREAAFRRSYQAANFTYAEAEREQSLNQVITRPVIETSCIGGLLAIVAVQILRGAPVQSFAGILSVFAIAAMRLLPSFNRIMSNCSSVMASLPSLDALYHDMKCAEQMRRARPPQQGVPIELKDAIRVERVTFTYPHKDTPVLKDVSFTIPRNEVVAIIGQSGAGKTTVADIILGLMQPQSGRVLADGVDIYRNLAEWHKKIAYIPQTIYLMDDTIKGNILFGLPEEQADETRLWNAVRSAQLEAFLRDQPDGINTRVGDRGVKLSGGQRQRIGIARALYHDPEILVLDEATSALDQETETAVMQAIESLQGSKTLIIIAHRLTTIRNCDRIYEVRHQQVIPRTRAEVFS